MPTHWKNLANYDYLGAYSLTSTNSIVLTISDIKRERVTATGGVSEDCVVAYFKETQVGDVLVKPMVFNKTNCKTVESLYGCYIEDWIGKKITVFKTETKFQRDMVPCLRIKKEIPANTEPTYYCSVCGSVMEKSLYDATMKKYGVAICSKECAEKYNKENQRNEEEK
ncbi:MAG: hypothetical protein IKF82_01135 [Bacilli bacterium]|nr:hypothetical protein [Bacilli bacterium]